MVWRPHEDSNKLLHTVVSILNDYGYCITQKQLYYILIRKGELDNSTSDYRKLSNLVLNARKHGRIAPTFFVSDKVDDIPEIMSTDAYLADSIQHYNVNKMLFQGKYLEIWTDRPSMKVFVENLTSNLNIPVYCCEGFSSYSFTYRAHNRVGEIADRGIAPRILYLSDLSPASNAIYESILKEMASLLELSSAEVSSFIFRPFILPEHILRFNLPTIPTKANKAQSTAFTEKYGDILEAVGLNRLTHVEIESVDPKDLRDLIFNVIFSILDYEKVQEASATEEMQKMRLASSLGISLEDLSE